MREFFYCWRECVMLAVMAATLVASLLWFDAAGGAGESANLDAAAIMAGCVV